MRGNKPVYIDGSDLFAAVLLVAGFVVGALVVLVALWLALQKLRRHFHGKTELAQEQAMAVAVAEALVIQHFYDNDHGSGKGACI